MLTFASIGFGDVVDPFDNMAAPPGTLAVVSYFGQVHYPDFADNNGHETDFGMDLSYMAIRTVYFAGKIADSMSYGVNAVLPLTHISLDGANNEFGLGDIMVGPFLYLYENADAQLYLSLWEFIYTPTGDYSKNNAVNIGRDAWAFQHQFALGWYPGKFGVDFCANYWQITESDKLKYDDADTIEFEAVFHYGITEKFRVGINVDYFIGLDDVKIDGVTIPNTEPSIFKLGLNLSYAIKENFIVGLRWMHDVDVENYPTGDQAYVRFVYVF
jgi:hypothetical protein